MIIIFKSNKRENVKQQTDDVKILRKCKTGHQDYIEISYGKCVTIVKCLKKIHVVREANSYSYTYAEIAPELSPLKDRFLAE